MKRVEARFIFDLQLYDITSLDKLLKSIRQVTIVGVQEQSSSRIQDVFEKNKVH